MFDESSLIEGTYSNKVESSEITKNLPDSISFVFKQLITEYLLTYQKLFLARIIIEADIDMLGVVFDTLKINCRFKANLDRYAITSSDLLNSILDQTVSAERTEIIETPPTEIKLHLLRHKVRSIQVISDYAKHEAYVSLYRKKFESDFKLSLLGLIKLYETDSSSHQASARLSFDLTKRDHLVFSHGNVYTNEELVFDNQKGEFKDQQVENVLSQVHTFLNALSNAQISGLSFNLNHIRKYKIEFKLSATSHPKNYIDLNDLDTVALWNTNLSRIAQTYSIYTLANTWLQNTTVDLEPSATGWIVKFHSFNVTYNFNSIITEKHIFDIVSAVADEIKDRAKVFRIEVKQQKQFTKMLKLDIEPELPDKPIETKPMKLVDQNLDAEITHVLDLSNEGFYLKEDIFKKRVK